MWDGDWALLEEYSPNNVLLESYLQSVHGLPKTLSNGGTYYYQDSMGSTSHIANSSGALLESYRYDVYGKPRFYDAINNQLSTSNFSVKDLHTGQRWVPEVGLYDDRNRFMSPELGRFLQPDPIGFKGDASNLYRYCGNNWANRADVMGLQGSNPASVKLTADQLNNEPPETLTGDLDSSGDVLTVTGTDQPGRTLTTSGGGAPPGTTSIGGPVGGQGVAAIPRGLHSGGGRLANAAPRTDAPTIGGRGTEGRDGLSRYSFSTDAAKLARIGRGFDGHGLRQTADAIDIGVTVYLGAWGGALITPTVAPGAVMAWNGLYGAIETVAYTGAGTAIVAGQVLLARPHVINGINQFAGALTSPGVNASNVPSAVGSATNLAINETLKASGHLEMGP